MTTSSKLWFMGALAVVAMAGCSVDRADDKSQGYYFQGQVVDGFKNTKVTNYKLTITSAGQTLTAKVDSTTGEFSVGPINDKLRTDYAVHITADGYRSFTSVQSADDLTTLLNANSDPKLQTTKYFQAFLFPTDVQSPAATLNFFFADKAEKPAGKLRLIPSATTATSAVTLEAPGRAPVNGQQWENDDDKLVPAILKDIADGQAKVDAGELIFGVEYSVLVYGVDGYQYSTDGVVVGGVTGDISLALTRLVGVKTGDLQLVAKSNGPVGGNAPNGITADGSLTLQFNHPIEIDPSRTDAAVAEDLDDALQIDDASIGGASAAIGGRQLPRAAAAMEVATTQENGVKVAVSGNTVTLTWGGTLSGTAGAMDPQWVYVVWNSLGSVKIRAVGDTTSSPVAITSISPVANSDVHQVASTEYVQIAQKTQ